MLHCPVPPGRRPLSRVRGQADSIPNAPATAAQRSAGFDALTLDTILFASDGHDLRAAPQRDGFGMPAELGGDADTFNN